MFSSRIANSARFLQMPTESQLLYFHLVLRADDDGVVESYPVMRLLGVASDNFKVLQAKGFIQKLNEDQVVVITDWLEHNTIRADRKVDSIYKHLLPNNIPTIEAKPRSDVKDNSNRLGGQSTDSISKVKLSKVKLSKDIPPLIPPTPTVVAIKKKFSSLKDIDQEVLLDIADKYNVPIGLVELNFEKMKAWLESSGKVKKDYRATLRGFVLRDISQVGLRRMENRRGVADGTDIEGL